MSKNTNTYTTYSASHHECAQLIKHNGSNISYIIEGEPGIGKSSILKTLEKECGDKYEYIYVDVPLLDVPDICLSMPDHETQTTKAFMHTRWLGKDPTKPKCIMLDEIFKGTPYVQLMLNRLLLEKTVGDYELPDGSIVFGATNFSSDGVGDKANGHTNSRVARIMMRKPNQAEGINWGVNNNINSLVLAWANQNPMIFNSYKDTEFDSKLHGTGQGIFHYIYHPQHNNTAYVCPRTLELASHQLHNMATDDNPNGLSESLTEKALIGTLGIKAALDMTALIDLSGDLPRVEYIIANPNKAKVPKNIAAQMMMVYKSLQYLNKDNIDNWVTYFARFGLEIQATWTKIAIQSDTLKNMVCKNKQVGKFITDNGWIL